MSVEMHAGEIVSRSLAAIVGGFIATNAIVYAFLAWLPTAPVTSLYLTGQWAFVPYVLLMLWAFGARNTLRAWAVPAMTTAGCVAVGLVGGLVRGGVFQ